ncbi:MAG: M20 family metallopeptidase [Erysipelotrichaceae bacterium]
MQFCFYKNARYFINYMNIEEIKNNCDIYLDSNMKELWEISKYIHSNPELAFNESKACEAMTTFLEKEGFQVKKGLGKLETAFNAEFTHEKGDTVIAVLAEYDALPGIGHACGHNLIACSALGTAIELKKIMIDANLKGTLRIIGTPAEEDGGGKIILLNSGEFENVDAVFLLHPTSGVTRIAGECMSSTDFEIEFIGKSAHAGAHPEDGVNALDAATLFYSGIAMMRQQLKVNSKMSFIFKDGGNTTSLIPDHASVLCNAYSFNYKDLHKLNMRIKMCAKGIALATGCEVNILENPGYAGRIPNEILSNHIKKELIKIEEPIMDGMPFDYGGEDLGDISRHIPICNLYVTIFDEHKISNHTDQFRELAISPSGFRCIQVGSKAMSRAAGELFLHPEIIEYAKNELEERLKNE